MNKQPTTTKEKNPTGTVLLHRHNKMPHLTKILQTSRCTLQQHLLHVPAAGDVFSTLPVWMITRLRDL